jgi:hypothetical protein
MRELTDLKHDSDQLGVFHAAQSPLPNWRLTCDGSTIPQPGWTCSNERCAGDRKPARRGSGP